MSETHKHVGIKKESKRQINNWTCIYIVCGGNAWFLLSVRKKKGGMNAVLTDSQTPAHCTIPRVPLLAELCGWLHS